MATIAVDLTARAVIITALFSVISFAAVRRLESTPGQLAAGVPLLVVLLGAVMLISILYDLRTFHVWDAKR